VLKMVGKLETGIMAPGGQTTGVQITAGDVVWELDLTKEKELRAQADTLKGKTVEIAGTLTVKPKVGRPGTRTIVTVTSLKAADK
jgi:hypothetical protein